MPISRWIPGLGDKIQNPATTVGDEKDAPITTAEYKQFGFENFGNTCYCNSVLQALYFCHPFRELVIQSHDSSLTLASATPPSSAPQQPQTPAHQSQQPRIKNNRKPSTPDVRQGSDAASGASAQPSGPPIPPAPPTLFSALRSLFVHISSNTLDKGTVAPRAFVDKVKKENELFRSSMHQDAHEFLNYLLNKIAEDLEEEAKHRSRNSSGEDLSKSIVTSSSIGGPSNVSSATTLVHNLFEGVLTSETRCLTCETVSSRDESFLDLSIDIEQNSSVTACLRQFSASEMLCQKNKFFCDSCCGLQEAEKRMKIKKLPNVLALHLKRFKYQEDVGKYIKLAYRVAFPLELRLFNTVDDAQDPDRLYELFAIVVHIGNGPHHGHYVAIVRSRGKWVVFDDDSVDTIKESDIPKYFGDSNSGSAYVLYYQAVDLDMASLGLRTAEPASTPAPVRSAALAPVIVPTPAPPTPGWNAAPLLPPGLIPTDEDSSDATGSESPAPTTPASPPLAFPHPKTPSPPLTVTIPSAEPSPVLKPPLPTTPVATSANGKPAGFFNALRHSPSVRPLGRHSAHMVPAPPTPQLPSDGHDASPVPPVTVATNGKHSKEKAISGWFGKRWSVKVERTQESVALPPPPSSVNVERAQVADDASFVTSTASHGTTLLSEDTMAYRGLHGSPELMPPPREGSIGSGSTTSSSVSAAAPVSFPSLPSTSASLLIPLAPAPHLRPGHNASQPALTAQATPADRVLAQPTTAGTVPRSPHLDADETSPRPPMPSILQQPSTPDADAHRRPGATPPSAHTKSIKRASRKISFTGGILFGRKDKDRHREKEKDNGHTPLPTIAASTDAGLAPEMPPRGRV